MTPMAVRARNRICPVEHAGMLDLNLRKLFQNPKKMLGLYVHEGMKVLDMGCGPGFFTMEIAKMVGETGKVTAADRQEGMLEKLDKKIRKAGIQNIIKLHKCGRDAIGLSEKFDYILIFYMLHEVPSPSDFLREIKILLKPNGKVFIAEPKFHVSKHDFGVIIEMMKNMGYKIVHEPKILLSRTIVASIKHS
jgi:ubiquinone/menaquinone biosynthesis C-methylase UbiE